MVCRIEGTSSLYEFLGDAVVYRNLVPADPRLPSFAGLRETLGLEGLYAPRKVEPAYGQVVAAILRQARAFDRPRVPLRRLLYLGDTRMNDGTAFRHLCAAGGWPGRALIVEEEADRPCAVQEGPADGPSGSGRLYLANRWRVLLEFLEQVQREGFPLDEGTAVVVDVDKTAIAARGRNDRSIDEARVEGLERTVAALLGPAWNPEAFHRAYAELNRPAYHAFTADNQDYLAYLCLALGAGLLDLAGLVAEVRNGALRDFGELIARVDRRRGELARSGLLPIHDAVWQRFRAGDPTPFKAFRRQEYLATAARFGRPAGADVNEVLRRQIVITGEVRAAARMLRAQGALLLAISDKPDEAALPDEEQARAGMKPLHRLETAVVAEAGSIPGDVVRGFPFCIFAGPVIT